MRVRGTIVASAVLAVFGLGWTAGQVFSQDQPGEKKAEESQPGMPTAEQMKLWMEAMTPGESHKRMTAHCGEWTTTGRYWMDPKGPPTEIAGAGSIRMILGGRFQVQEAKSSMMGMPFEGFGITGYDNVAKEYVNVWMDSMGTMMMVSRGKEDDKGVRTLRGEFVDPMNPNASPVKCRLVFPPSGQDNFRFEMWSSDSKHPEEFKCMEMDYARKK